MPTRWKPTFAIKATFAVHAAAAVGCVMSPAIWPGASGARVINPAIFRISNFSL